MYSTLGDLESGMTPQPVQRSQPQGPSQSTGGPPPTQYRKVVPRPRELSQENHKFVLDQSVGQCAPQTSQTSRGNCQRRGCPKCHPICSICHQGPQTHRMGGPGKSVPSDGPYQRIQTNPVGVSGQMAPMQFAFSLNQPDQGQMLREFHDFQPDTSRLKGHVMGTDKVGTLCNKPTCSLCVPMFCALCGKSKREHG